MYSRDNRSDDFILTRMSVILQGSPHLISWRDNQWSDRDVFPLTGLNVQKEKEIKINLAPFVTSLSKIFCVLF